MLVIAAPATFAGTASAAGMEAAIARAAEAAGATCDQAPVASGGEGTLDALGGVAGDVLAGELPELPASVRVISLVARFGQERALTDVAGCVAEVVGVAVRDLAW